MCAIVEGHRSTTNGVFLQRIAPPPPRGESAVTHPCHANLDSIGSWVAAFKIVNHRFHRSVGGVYQLGFNGLNRDATESIDAGTTRKTRKTRKTRGARTPRGQSIDAGPATKSFFVFKKVGLSFASAARESCRSLVRGECEAGSRFAVCGEFHVSAPMHGVPYRWEVYMGAHAHFSL